MYAGKGHRGQRGGDYDGEPALEPRLEEAGPHRLSQRLITTTASTMKRNCLPTVTARSAVCNEPPKKIRASRTVITGKPKRVTAHQLTPNLQRSARASRARTPARPSVIAVTQSAAGRMTRNVAASANTSMGRPAPGITCRLASIGIVKINQQRTIAKIRNVVSGYRATSTRIRDRS